MVNSTCLPLIFLFFYRIMFAGHGLIRNQEVSIFRSARPSRMSSVYYSLTDAYELVLHLNLPDCFYRLRSCCKEVNEDPVEVERRIAELHR